MNELVRLDCLICTPTCTAYRSVRKSGGIRSPKIREPLGTRRVRKDEHNLVPIIDLRVLGTKIRTLSQAVRVEVPAHPLLEFMGSTLYHGFPAHPQFRDYRPHRPRQVHARRPPAGAHRIADR